MNTGTSNNFNNYLFSFQGFETTFKLNLLDDTTSLSHLSDFLIIHELVCLMNLNNALNNLF